MFCLRYVEQALGSFHLPEYLQCLPQSDWYRGLPEKCMWQSIYSLWRRLWFSERSQGDVPVCFYKSLGEGILPPWSGTAFLIVFGFFAGIFVGCLALAIAEMLNSIPIFSRRTGFRHGLGIALLFAALGKMAGSIFYFLFIQ
jgi:hypothetical protein